MQEANDFSFADPLKNKHFKMVKGTLKELIIHCDEYNVTFVSLRTISKNTGKNINTIQNHLKILTDLGIVEVLEIRGNFGKKNYRKINLNVLHNVPVDVPVNVLHNVPVDVPVNVSATVTELEENIREENRMDEHSPKNASSKPNIPTAKEVLQTWNDNAEQFGFSTIKSMSDARYKKFKTRLAKDDNFLDNFLEAIEIASQSSFIMNNTFFTFDWLVANDENYLKVIEGNYNNKGKK